MGMKLIHISLLKSVKGIPYHAQHIRKLVRLKKFPQPVEGVKPPLFVDSEVDEYVERLIAARLQVDGGRVNRCRHISIAWVASRQRRPGEISLKGWNPFQIISLTSKRN